MSSIATRAGTYADEVRRSAWPALLTASLSVLSTLCACRATAQTAAETEPNAASSDTSDTVPSTDTVPPADADTVSSANTVPSADTVSAADTVPPPPIGTDTAAANPDDAHATTETEEEGSDAALDVISAVMNQLNVQIHGFASQGYILTTSNNYLARTRDGGSFEFSEIGLNFTVQPVDNLRIGAQLFSRDLGPIGNYSIRADWFYIDYRFADWFGVRAGRTKLPFGLYNEVNDIDVARVPVLLPQGMYPVTSRDFLLAQTGVEVYGRIPLDLLGTLDYRLYGGTIFLDFSTTPPGSPLQVASLNVPYVLGGRVLWETPLEGLRGGVSVQAIRLDTQLLRVSDGMRFNVDIAPALLWVASVEYASGGLLLAAEYGRWHTTTTSSDTTVFPAASSASERAHVMAAYRFASWFYPGVYYSLMYPNVDDRRGREAQQHDIALTLRFDINDFWLVKLEGHYMHGTAATSAALNDGTPPSMLAANWGVFIIKTTGYF